MELTPQQVAAAEYAAQFDIQDEPTVAVPEPPERTEQPRRADGTFKKVHPARLTALAADLGIPAEDIDGLETPDLERVVSYTARQALRMQRVDSANQRTILNSVDKNLGQPQPAPPPVEVDHLAELSETLDPRLFKVLSDLRAENARLKGVEARVETIDQRDNARQMQSSAEIIDEAFAALGPTYERFVGKGNAVDGDLQQEDLQRRLAILQQTGLDVTKPMGRRQAMTAIQKAATLLYGTVTAAAPKTAPNPYAPAEPEPLQARRKEWQEGGVAKPTQRTSAPEPPGRKRAIASVGRMMEAQRSTETSETNGSAEPEDFLE